jgi:uncharacterized protein
MDVDWTLLHPETLHALAEAYVLREGTDYGAREIAHETKIEQVLRLLRAGQAKVVFDAETESCDIREVPEA